MELFTSYVDAGLKFVKKSCSQGIDQVRIILLVTIVTDYYDDRSTYLKWLQSAVY